MGGLLVVLGSVVGGSVIAAFDDPVAGLSLIVVGAICGCVITWIELS